MEIFSWAQTLERYDGNQKTAKEIARLFFKELPQVQLAIAQMRQKKDTSGLYAQLHKLHGSCCFVSVPELKGATQALCRAVQHCPPENIDSLADLLNNFDAALSRLTAYGNSPECTFLNA